MCNSKQQEWESPSPNIEPDSDEIFIPKIPWDEGNTLDGDDNDNDDDDNGDESEGYLPIMPNLEERR